MGPMTERHYYRLALATPPVVHGLLAAVPNPLQVWAALSIASVGIPYLIWAAVMLLVIRNSSLALLRKLVLLAPVVCLGVFVVCFVAYFGFWIAKTHPWTLATLPVVVAHGVVGVSREILGLFVISILSVGYFWTLIAWLGWRLIASREET